MGRTISIVELQSGIGQSFFGTNLAVSIAAQTQTETSVIDLSFSSSNEMDILLNCTNGKSILDILPLLPIIDSTMMSGYLTRHNSGIAVLNGIENGQKGLVEPSQINRIINLVSEVYSYTILISPKEYDKYFIATMESSDIILLLIEPNLISLNRAKAFLNTYKSSHLPLNLIKPIITRLNTPSKVTAKNIEDCIQLKILAEIVYKPENINSSINAGIPVMMANSHCDFSSGIKELTCVILKNNTFPDKSRNTREVSPNQEENKCKVKTEFNRTLKRELKNRIHIELIKELDSQKIELSDLTNPDKMASLRNKTTEIIADLLSKSGETLSRSGKGEFTEELVSEVLGLGCLEEYLSNPEITEIMVNGPDKIYIEKKGKIELTGSSFYSAAQLNTIIDRIVSPIGRRVDESSPLVDARLSDGSRVNVIIPPVSLTGTTLTIRKFSKEKLTVNNLIDFGALSADMASFLKICVELRKNIIISGGTGSGKTTLLNVISSFIPADERIITIEDSAELCLPQEHVVSLESRKSSVEGTGEISIRQLVLNTLRMRPDRIIIGECRGGEALDMLQAMNTGHDGSITTIHSNTPKDAVTRIVTMVMMSGTQLPEPAIKGQISSAVNLIVQLSRFSDGSRKITDITELVGTGTGEISLIPLFNFKQKEVIEGKVCGKFSAEGNIPSFYNDIGKHGLFLNSEIFSKGASNC